MRAIKEYVAEVGIWWWLILTVVLVITDHVWVALLLGLIVVLAVFSVGLTLGILDGIRDLREARDGTSRTAPSAEQRH